MGTRDIHKTHLPSYFIKLSYILHGLVAQWPSEIVVTRFMWCTTAALYLVHFFISKATRVSAILAAETEIIVWAGVCGAFVIFFRLSMRRHEYVEVSMRADHAK